ncbi:hypothetical protein RHMOL_Rhmol08G0142100 [Rhododendron molle]|uniref:Uncharacterized protein n=1 Tax=Rhododendron molle TaxID=49168 RepID=A0ACC0MN76_RHOML|nr:hypothetical protein RHMOL_Rhmol08G0142100 [Rhododendron molle]
MSQEFTDKLIEEELSADQKDAFQDFVRKKVGEGKKANREAREARKKALAEMSEKTKTAFQNMKFYKFYPVPTPDSPDVSNFKFTVEKFSIERVNKSGAVFHSTKLRWMNGQHLRSFSLEELTKLMGQHWKSTGILAESEGMFVEITTLFHIPVIQSVP